MMQWRKVFLIVLFILVILFSQDLMAQCSQCKLLAEQSAADDEILGTKATTINSAILYIMVIPYIALTILFRKQIKGFFKKLFKTA
jgi:hypothetical protein